MSKDPTNKELIERVLESQNLALKNDLQYAANISIIMNRQDELKKQQDDFNLKISSLLFTDSDTNRLGYIASHDNLDKRVSKIEKTII